jgi:DNA-binding MarR family transcriptional regulator
VSATAGRGVAARREQQQQQQQQQSELDEVWQLVMNVVSDNLSDWRRKVADVTGLPFSRARALRRLSAGPLRMRELAARCETDAPATTLIVDDLEAQGLVARVSDPDDRRVKRVSLTRAGEKLLARTHAMPDIAPAKLVTLEADELATLKRIFAKLAR